jgi:hypothetical protein
MNPLKYIKVLGNELCPCGSDDKYRDCCKNKVVEVPQTSKKPPEVQVMEMMRKSMKKCCMHPNKGHCKGKIKEAHALQNNKIISMLAIEGISNHSSKAFTVLSIGSRNAIVSIDIYKFP